MSIRKVERRFIDVRNPTMGEIRKEQEYPCDACGHMTPDSQLLSITGRGIDSGNPVQICKKCHESAESEEESEYEYDEMDPR